MNKNLIIVGVVIITLFGFVFFINQKPQIQNENNKPSQPVSLDKSKMISGYSGKVLAGNKTPYIIFNKTDYDKAVSDNKIIFLDFYANWCPICRGEAPEIISAFDSLTSDNVVGFRVNYNDSDTDSDEKALAEKLEIPYQHTKVILKNGNILLKNGEVWDKNRFIEEITKVLN